MPPRQSRDKRDDTKTSTCLKQAGLPGLSEKEREDIQAQIDRAVAKAREDVQAQIDRAVAQAREDARAQIERAIGQKREEVRAQINRTVAEDRIRETATRGPRQLEARIAEAYATVEAASDDWHLVPPDERKKLDAAYSLIERAERGEFDEL